MSSILIEHTQVFGWQAAIRGMRNSWDSWERSDSGYGNCNEPTCSDWHLGPADLDLACRLIRAGASDRKFLRFIIVQCDWTLPRYLWSEADTYRYGRERNSCSTMHRLGSRDLTADDFDGYTVNWSVLDQLNAIGREMRAGKRTNDLVEEAKRILPEGFLQKSTMQFSYETLLKMHRERVKHRLPAWQPVCRWIESLPYMQAFLAAATRGDK